MRVLVTGGAGFIGRHLVNNLIDDGAEVLVLDSGFTGQFLDLNKKAKLVKVDLDNCGIGEYREFLDGVEQVFHLAAQKHNTSGVTPEKMFATNILSTYNLALASALSNVKRFVFTSSLYVYGSLGPEVMKEGDVPKPSTLYGASKLMGENILRFAERQYGLSWNIARLFFIYGPGQFAGSGYKSVIVKNFERIRDGLPVTINGDGKQSLDYVYVQDAVEGIKLLANSKIQNKIFNISSSISISINDLFLEMEESSGRRISRFYENEDWTSGSQRYGDNSLIKSELGWSPQVSLNNGLSQTWNFINNASLSRETFN
jgi:UDP-glucose 4-epimerase